MSARDLRDRVQDGLVLQPEAGGEGNPTGNGTADRSDALLQALQACQPAVEVGRNRLAVGGPDIVNGVRVRHVPAVAD